MKYYRNYKAKKFKFPKRLVFILAFALAVIGLTLLLGNYLKHRLDNAPIDTSNPPQVVTTDENDNQETTPQANHDEALLHVSAGLLDLSGCTDKTDLRTRVQAVKTAGYNAVSYIVTDSAGRLTYASPGAEQMSRLPSKDTLVSLEMLTTATTYAKEMGLRSCAVFEAIPAQVQTDTLIAGELASAGFDEMVIRGFESYEALDNETVDAILTYVRSLRERAQMDMGICLSRAIYTAAYHAPYIEKIFRETEFFAIDLTDASVENTAEIAQSLQGSFTAYLLRAVLDGSDAEESTEVRTALEDADIHSMLYISAPPTPATDDTTEDE